MAEYIEREAAVAVLRENIRSLVDGYCTHLEYGGKTDFTVEAEIGAMEIAQSLVAAVPAADVQEVRHGEWVYNRHQAPDEQSFFCSLCVEGGSDYGADNYCPNCGAKMDGKGDA